MALLRIQYGDTKGLYRHLGDYCTLCAIDGFHQESRWPAGLSQVDLQERRRLVCYSLYNALNRQVEHNSSGRATS